MNAPPINCQLVYKSFKISISFKDKLTTKNLDETMIHIRNKIIYTAIFFILPASNIWSQEAPIDAEDLIQHLGLEESDIAVRDLPGWRKPDKVHIDFSSYGNSREQEYYRQSAREVAGDVEIVEVGRRLDEEILPDVQVLIGRCNPGMIRNAKNLHWVQHSSHGVDDCLSPETVRMEFILTNAQHTSAPPIAEHAIALMMSMSRGLNSLHQAQARHEWVRRSIDFPIIEIEGKTMLVVGLGGIGTAIAKKAHALGMRIIATRNSSRSGPEFVEYVGLSHEVYDLAGQADVIVNSLPLTDDTNDLFDRKFFDSVKRGAYYISTGRGETTVTADLVDALKDGRLAAAGLDVTDPEPLPPENELWSLPNVIITPHVAANTDQGRWRRWLTVRENLRRYINGDKLLNVVDKELGY